MGTLTLATHNTADDFFAWCMEIEPPNHCYYAAWIDVWGKIHAVTNHRDYLIDHNYYGARILSSSAYLDALNDGNVRLIIEQTGDMGIEHNLLLLDEQITTLIDLIDTFEPPTFRGSGSTGDGEYHGREAAHTYLKEHART